MILRTQLLQDPKSGAHPLFGQDASRFIAAAVRTGLPSEPGPEGSAHKKSWAAKDAARRASLCHEARIHALGGVGAGMLHVTRLSTWRRSF